MNFPFYKKNNTNNDDLLEQSKTLDKMQIIEEIQEKYILYIDHYLKKEQNKGVDAPLFDFIDANQDQEKVIIYIDYKLENTDGQLSEDDTLQLKDLKTILEKQDYKEKIHIFPHNVNFDILSGVYTEQNGEKHNIVNQYVKKSKRNRFKLFFQAEGSNRKNEYEIHYDGSDYVSIYNEFGTRISRENLNKGEENFIEGNKYRKEQYQIPGNLNFETKKGNINLDLLFVA